MEDKNIALLIDADNISPKYVKSVFDELNSYGTVSIRRIYGNWKKKQGWNEELLLEYSIQPIQQFDYTKGKNATDMAMTIDAMDVLYLNQADIFCIISSDSDFTKLAMRLRESQKYVIGMGDSKTPVALTKSCNKFVFLDLIVSDDNQEDEEIVAVTTSKSKKETKAAESNVTPLSQLEDAIINMIPETGAVSLGEVGSRLNKLFSDFDVRNYGYTKLSTLCYKEFATIHITKQDLNYFVSLRSDVDVETVTVVITEFIKAAGGSVENLSKIHEFLKEKYKSFNIKDYGYSRFSSFLRSLDGIVVEGNKVRLKTKNKKRKIAI